MEDIKFTLLHDAFFEFQRNNISGFVDNITELLTQHLVCHCYLRCTSNEMWKLLKIHADRIDEDTNDYNINISKGIIYLLNERDDIAISYLTNAIKVNPDSEIAYSLRAWVNKNYNSLREVDAEKAVKINPSARNYFRLGAVFGDNYSSIEYLRKSIFLDSSVACSHNNLGDRYKNIGDFRNAIHEYQICISIDPNHWCYLNLGYCLIKYGDSTTALDYLYKGNLIHSNNRNHYYALGIAYKNLENYDDAYGALSYYLGQSPSTEKNILEVLKEVELLAEAKWQYFENNIKYSNKLFEEYIALGSNLSNDNLTIFYQVKLKLKNEKIEFGKRNIYRIRFNKLRDSYHKKTFAEAKTEEEESVNKLSAYKKHFKIGFGIYMAHKIEEVIKQDPQYIIWCIINLDHFALDNVLLHEPFFWAFADYFKALEINIIKIDLIREWKEERESDYSESIPPYDLW